jgi:hypothetical protein
MQSRLTSLFDVSRLELGPCSGMGTTFGGAVLEAMSLALRDGLADFCRQKPGRGV